MSEWANIFKLMYSVQKMPIFQIKKQVHIFTRLVVIKKKMVQFIWYSTSILLRPDKTWKYLGNTSPKPLAVAD